MIAAATNPPTAAPSEKPQIIVVTAVPRRRRGMYSEVSAMAFGIAPPIPSPVRARNATSASTDCAVAVSSEPTPKISAHPMSTGRRPNWSASGPLTIAPIIIPTRPLEMTGPSTLRGICIAELSAGATYPIACASNPSTKTRSEHIAATMQLVSADRPLVDELADVEGGRWLHRCALLYKSETNHQPSANHGPICATLPRLRTLSGGPVVFGRLPASSWSSRPSWSS